jgi:hypothetical protein
MTISSSHDFSATVCESIARIDSFTADLRELAIVALLSSLSTSFEQLARTIQNRKLLLLF